MGVVAYFLLIFALCLLVFIIVMVQLSRIKKQNPQNQPPNRGVMTDLRSIAGLIVLLGLTWGFALFAWGPLYLPFVYLFTIFNSLQGETCIDVLFMINSYKFMICKCIPFFSISFVLYRISGLYFPLCCEGECP